MPINLITAIPATYRCELTQATFFLNEETDKLFDLYSASPNQPTEDFKAQAETVAKLQYIDSYLTFMLRCFPPQEPRT